MARLIAVVGNKGGSGKSTTAHLVAHGCGSFGRFVRAVVLTTDPLEHPRADRRRYAVVDARTREQLAQEIRRLSRIDRLLMILDGAAARPDIDAIVAAHADLAVLPYKPSAQDAERAAEDMQRLPRAVALPMDWPTHPGVARRAKRYLSAVPVERRLAPFKHLPRLDELLGDGYAEAAYDLATPARNLALEVLAAAGIDPDDLRAPPAPRGDKSASPQAAVPA